MSDSVVSSLEQLGKELHGSAHNLRLEDFYAIMPMAGSFLFIPTREIWPASSVDARIPPLGSGKEKVKASRWLASNRPANQITWAPGLPMLIKNRVAFEGGWLDHEGATCFNLYRPPILLLGDAAKARPWVDHAYKVFPNDAGHIIQWLAHRVQKPAEKINHALVLIGNQGVGKDTLLEPVAHAVGPWNFGDATPPEMLAKYNPFLKSVILRVSEARDLGDVSRYDFYERMKLYIAAPPMVLRVDEKHVRQYLIPNIVGVVITSNHPDSLYLPSGDRRHYFASNMELKKEDFREDYWTALYGYYKSGGCEHVAAYLHQVDLSDFDPKAPPPKTAAFHHAVNVNQAPENDDLGDALDQLGDPEAASIGQLINRASETLAAWL
jgi:hypothetical protein